MPDNETLEQAIENEAENVVTDIWGWEDGMVSRAEAMDATITALRRIATLAQKQAEVTPKEQP